MIINFTFSKEMTEEDIEEFKSIIGTPFPIFDSEHLEGKVVSKIDYPLTGSFKIGENVIISRGLSDGSVPVICNNYSMFDDFSLVAGETHEDRKIVSKIVKNWESVKNFVEMLDS